MRTLLILSLLAGAACGRDSLLRDAGTGGGGGTTGGGGGTTGGGGGSVSCVGLGVEACRARSDCAADFCFQCTCTPQFKGCRATTATPFDCPALGCLSLPCCQTDAACQNAERCEAPGTPQGCGTCNAQPSLCTSDGECGATEICAPRACACSGQTDCAPGCSVTNPCGTGTTCVNKHCQPTTCSAAAPCPATFSCVSGTCRRKSCTTDVDCADGFCVTGTCHESWGECRMPHP